MCQVIYLVFSQLHNVSECQVKPFKFPKHGVTVGGKPLRVQPALVSLKRVAPLSMEVVRTSTHDVSFLLACNFKYLSVNLWICSTRQWSCPGIAAGAWKEGQRCQEVLWEEDVQVLWNHTLCPQHVVSCQQQTLHVRSSGWL